jgi:hypothetical protein
VQPQAAALINVFIRQWMSSAGPCGNAPDVHAQHAQVRTSHIHGADTQGSAQRSVVELQLAQ